MKFSRALAVLSIMATLGLSSCGDPAIRSAKALYAEAISVPEALDAKDLNPDTRHMLELAYATARYAADSYGLAESAGRLRFLPGSRENLAWRLAASRPDSVTALEIQYFTDRAATLTFSEELTAKGLASHFEPHESLRWAIAEPAPLLESFSSWPYEKLVDWVFLQIFENACAGSRSPDDLKGFPVFAAEKATIEFLTAQLSAASPVVARYTSERRDARTFSLLYNDYRVRFVELYAQNPLPADTPKRREILSSTWLAEYRSSYSNRFLTNLYSRFGDPPVSNAHMAAWENRYTEWNRLDKQYSAQGKNLRGFIESMLSR